MTPEFTPLPAELEVDLRVGNDASTRYDGAVKLQQTQLVLAAEEHRRARQRAAELGISLAESIRRLVRDDLGGDSRRSDASALFALGDSGGSDVARRKDEYLGQAVAGDSPR
jgi:hypothetical protein